MILATLPKENEEATVSPLTMACGRHHEPVLCSILAPQA